MGNDILGSLMGSFGAGGSAGLPTEHVSDDEAAEFANMVDGPASAPAGDAVSGFTGVRELVQLQAEITETHIKVTIAAQVGATVKNGIQETLQPR